MASRTVVELFDDLDGGRADETVTFSLDGVDYEIDLSKANAAALRDVFAQYVEHAHRAPVRAKRKSARKAKTGADMTAEIRRLASESARKVAEAAQAREPEADGEADDTAESFLLTPAHAGEQPGEEPLRALSVPFQEARL
ncbi:MAG TPA: Lsr2 family protein [Pseudonocardiaceae bacterium]|nr:Lsr2 family protein [Pseudonocardiaceae bacterium]